MGLVSMLTCLRRGSSGVRLCAFAPAACETVMFRRFYKPRTGGSRFDIYTTISFRWQGFLPYRLIDSCEVQTVWVCPEFDLGRCPSCRSLPFLRLLRPTIVLDFNVPYTRRSGVRAASYDSGAISNRSRFAWRLFAHQSLCFVSTSSGSLLMCTVYHRREELCPSRVLYPIHP